MLLAPLWVACLGSITFFRARPWVSQLHYLSNLVNTIESWCYRILISTTSKAKSDQLGIILVDRFVWIIPWVLCGFPGGPESKAAANNAGDPGSIPGSGRSSGEGNATQSSILAWEIPWTVEPGGFVVHGVAKSCTWPSVWACTHTAHPQKGSKGMAIGRLWTDFGELLFPEGLYLQPRGYFRVASSHCCSEVYFFNSRFCNFSGEAGSQ